MFCRKCGKEIQDNASFCPTCGSKVGEQSSSVSQPVKVMLDPAEAMPEKKVTDSSKTFKGQGGTFGTILMLLSVIFDVVAMFAIGFDAFIPITIGSTVAFVIGFFLRMFSI